MVKLDGNFIACSRDKLWANDLAKKKAPIFISLLKSYWQWRSLIDIIQELKPKILQYKLQLMTRMALFFPSLPVEIIFLQILHLHFYKVQKGFIESKFLFIWVLYFLINIQFWSFSCHLNTKIQIIFTQSEINQNSGFINFFHFYKKLTLFIIGFTEPKTHSTENKNKNAK